jgi:hypothetical protein
VNMKMCLNWKVIAGLVAAAVGILIVEPQLAARMLPLLLVAACPLSMLLMGGMNLVPAAPELPAPTATPVLANRVLTRKEQLAQLQAQLKSVAAQQAELAQQVEQLQAAEESAAPNRTLAEAELVAQAADNRPVRRN